MEGVKENQSTKYINIQTLFHNISQKELLLTWSRAIISKGNFQKCLKEIIRIKLFIIINKEIKALLLVIDLKC
jgi:hypothetical protein